MYQAKLSKTEEKSLKSRIKKERDGRILKRYQCIMMSHEGIQNIQIAKVLGVNTNTITGWVKLYLEEGLERLSKFDFSRRVSSLEEIKSEIKDHVQNELVSTMAELAGWIKETYDHEVETSWLGRWCKKNSIFLLKSQD